MQKKLVIFLLITLIFLLPTLLVGGYTFYSLTFIETFILLAGLISSLGKIKIYKSSINLPILLYILACILSTINSNYLRGSLEEICKLACCLIFFLMTGSYLATHLKLLIHTFIFTTLIVILISLTHFFIHLPESLNVRLYYPLGNPNILAGFLVITIPLIIRTVGIVRCRFLLVILLLVSFITLYLTHSRGGILGVVVAILVLFFINISSIRQSNKIIFTLILCLVIGIVLVMIYLFTFLWFHALFSRVEIWKFSFKMFLDNPILGIGLGSYPNVYFGYKGTSTWHLHSHNIFIQCACELGIIGLVSFVWLLVALFKENFTKMTNSYEKIIREGLLGSLIGFLIHSQVDYFLWLPIFQLYFWLILGVLSASSAKKYILSNLWRAMGIIIILFWSFGVLKPFLAYVSFNEGVELADKGKWEDAKIKFEKAVLLDFYHPIYHAHLSITYTKIHPPDLAYAIKEYKKAHQLDKYNPLFYQRVRKFTSLKKESTLSYKLYRRIPMLELDIW